jgi:translocation and assembly module TamB
MARIAKIVRGTLRALLYTVLGVLGLVALVYVALTLTPAGRGWARDFALEQANALFRGKLAARELSSLGIFGVTLYGAEVTDPTGAKVIVAESIAIEISPFALLSGEIYVDRVAIRDARIDLADLGSERGVIAAFALREPSPPDPNEPASEPPLVIVEAIELDAIAASAELPDLGVVGVEQLAVRGSFTLRGVASAELESLSAKLVRDLAEVGAIESAKGRWVQEGQDSTLALRGRVARTKLAVDARSRLPNDPEFERSPMTATVLLDAIDAETLRALGQPELAKQLKQALRAEIKARGTLDALDADIALSSDAGDVAVTAKLLERDRLAVHVASEGVTPGALWVGAPAERVVLDLKSNLRIARAPQDMPFDLDLTDASFGDSKLPVVRAKGRVENDAVCDLVLSAQGHGVTLELTGDAGAQKLNLHGTLRARDFELAGASAAALDADFTAVGPPTAPRAAIALRGTALKYETFVVDQLVLEALGGPERYDVELNARAPDGKVQLAAKLELQDEAVLLDATASGALRKRAFRLNVQQARVGFGGTVEVERAVVDGLGQRAVLRGRYGASARDRLELEAQLDLGALTEALQLETPLQGRADVTLTARGTIERPAAELSLRGKGLGVRDPARERPTVDATLGAALDTSKGELTVQAQVGSGTELDLNTQLAARFNARKAPWHRELLAAEIEGTLALDGLSTQWIERWLLEPLPMRGRVVADAKFAGTIERPELELQTRAQLRHPERADVYEVTLDTRYAAAEARLGLSVRDEQGEWITASAELAHPADTLQQFIAPGAALGHEAEWRAAVAVAPRALQATPLDALTRKPLDPELAAITVGLDLSATHGARSEPGLELSAHVSKPARGTNKVTIGLDERTCADQQLDLSVAVTLANGKLDVRAALHSAKQALLETAAHANVLLVPALSARGSPEVSDADAMVELSKIQLEALPRLCGMAQGRMSGRIDATNLLGANPKIDVNLHGDKLSLGSPVGIDLELRASATPDVAEAEIVFDHGKTRSTINASLPIRWQGSSFDVVDDRPIGAKVVLDRFPVMALLPPSFAISRASGYLSGEVNAGGTLSDPQVGGTIEPQRIALTVTGLAQPLHGIEGRIKFSNRRVTIERLRARDRDGSVEVNGAIDLAEDGEITAKISVEADEFPLRQQGQIAGEIDAQIDVGVRMTETRTRVDVTLKDASAWLLGGQLRKGISLDEHPDIRDPRAKPEREDDTPEAEEVPPEPIEISINAEDSFWVRRDDFAVKLSTKLELKIDDGKVYATGPIQIHRGYLQLFGQTFDIDGKSKVDLTGGTPPDPVLDITASTLNRRSSERIAVHIGGRASAPELEFSIDDSKVTAGEAAQAIFGRGGGGDDSAESEAKSFVAGMMAGVMAMSARRELGDAMPILMLEPGDTAESSRVRAGFELDKLVPGFLEGVIRGVYVEGIFAGSSGDENASSSGVQSGVLIELYLPHDLVTSGQYGPGDTWSVDLGWEP